MKSSRQSFFTQNQQNNSQYAHTAHMLTHLHSIQRVRSNSTSDIKPIAEEAATTPATAATAATSASLKNEGLLLRKYGSEWKELYFVLRGGYLHVYKNEVCMSLHVSTKYQ
jgi:hypothetical protein